MTRHFIIGSEPRCDGISTFYKIIELHGDRFIYHYIELYNDDPQVNTLKLAPPGLLQALKSYQANFISLGSSYADFKLDLYLQKLGFNMKELYE